MSDWTVLNDCVHHLDVWHDTLLDCDVFDCIRLCCAILCVDGLVYSVAVLCHNGLHRMIPQYGILHIATLNIVHMWGASGPSNGIASSASLLCVAQVLAPPPQPRANNCMLGYADPEIPAVHGSGIATSGVASRCGLATPAPSGHVGRTDANQINECGDSSMLAYRHTDRLE